LLDHAREVRDRPFADLDVGSRTAANRLRLTAYPSASGQCVGATEQRIYQIADLQKQLAAAQARIKELEPKPEKAAPPNNDGH
jgi:hypothetical protein